MENIVAITIDNIAIYASNRQSPLNIIDIGRHYKVINLRIKKHFDSKIIETNLAVHLGTK